MAKKKEIEDFSTYSLRDLLLRIAAIDYALRYPDHGLSRYQLKEIEDRRRRLSEAAAPHLARIRLDLPDSPGSVSIVGIKPTKRKNAREVRRVSVTDFKRRPGAFLAYVEKGRTIVVTRRSKPWVVIAPTGLLALLLADRPSPP